MFKRLIFDQWVILFPIIAFITASTIYVTIAWKAIKMKPTKVDHFANLPFNDKPEISNELSSQ